MSLMAPEEWLRLRNRVFHEKTMAEVRVRYYDTRARRARRLQVLAAGAGLASQSAAIALLLKDMPIASTVAVVATAMVAITSGVAGWSRTETDMRLACLLQDAQQLEWSRLWDEVSERQPDVSAWGRFYSLAEEDMKIHHRLGEPVGPERRLVARIHDEVEAAMAPEEFDQASDLDQPSGDG